MSPDAAPSDAITDIEVVPIALPSRRELRWLGMHEELGRWAIIRVRTRSGLVGYGEATPLGTWGGDFGRYFGETPATVRHVVVDHLAPLLEGLDPFDLHDACRRMDRAVRGHPYAKAAVEMALWDLKGKLCGLPLYKLLGGRARDGVPVAHMVGLMDVDGGSARQRPPQRRGSAPSS